MGKVKDKNRKNYKVHKTKSYLSAEKKNQLKQLKRNFHNYQLTNQMENGRTGTHRIDTESTPTAAIHVVISCPETLQFYIIDSYKFRRQIHTTRPSTSNTQH